MTKRIYLKIAIDKIRSKYKLNQKELADVIGITDGTVSNYVNKDRRPNFEHLYKICNCPAFTAEERRDLVNAYCKDEVRRLGFTQLPEIKVENPYAPLFDAACEVPYIKNILDAMLDHEINENHPRVAEEPSDYKP